MALQMKTQVAVAKEDYEGIAQSLSGSNLLPVLAGASMDMSLASIDRDLARQSLTHPLAVPSYRSGRFSFQMELMGPLSGFPGTVAPIDLPLQACGMKKKALRRVAIEASWDSGSVINDLETFTAAPSGATGIVWSDYLMGEPYIFYEVVAGTVTNTDKLTFSGGAVLDTAGSPQTCGGWRPEDQMLSQINLTSVTNGPLAVGDEILGGTSGARAVVAQATSGAGAQILIFERLFGGGHFVASETITVPGSSKSAAVAGGVTESQSQIPSVTLAAYHDGVVRQVLKGSRGTWSARLKNGDRVLITFDFQGCGVQPTDAALLTWPGTTHASPPVVTGGLFSIDKTFPPTFSEITFEGGCEVTLREFPGDSTGCGYESAHIVARRMRGSIDPEMVRESIKPLFGSAWNKTAMRLVARVGTAAGDGNTFEFRARRAQIDEPRVADRGRIRTYNLPLLLNGDGDDELLLFEF